MRRLWHSLSCKSSSLTTGPQERTSQGFAQSHWFVENIIYTSSLLIPFLATLESIINCDQGNLDPKEVSDGGEKYHSDETAHLLSPPQECIPNVTKTECRDIPYSIEASTITSPITPITPPDHENLDIIEADLYVTRILRI